MKNKLFKWVQLLLPVLVFVFLVGAVTNWGKIALSETPEITGSNGSTISNATDGLWDMDTTKLAVAGLTLGSDYVGINYFGDGEQADTILSDAIEYTSRSDHSVIQVTWADTMGAPGDTAVLSTHVFGVGSCLVWASQALTTSGANADTGFYGYNIFRK